MSLDELRKRIDSIDNQLVKLLNERAEVVIKVGGVLTAVIPVQLHVLIDIVILVMVTVCGDVIQLTV